MDSKGVHKSHTWELFGSDYRPWTSKWLGRLLRVMYCVIHYVYYISKDHSDFKASGDGLMVPLKIGSTAIDSRGEESKGLVFILVTSSQQTIFLI